jgi:septal ring factor EnvC (AmiA/AmiB activator)
MNQMSAKDKAFEKERVTYRQKVRDLQREIKQQAEEEYKLRKQLSEANNKILEQDDWIRRLLEYMDIEPGRLQALVTVDESISKLSNILVMGRRLGF